MQSIPLIPLIRRMVREAGQFPASGSPELTAKAKLVLLDYFSCAFEARDLAFARQAVEVARQSQGGPASVIAEEFRAAASEAAFANATMAHGLVREDMHTGSVSHLGVVVLPTLLALAESRTVSGQELITAIAAAYEAGAVIGKALMDAENVRLHRPTGITGPIGAALGGAMLAGLSEDESVSAVGLAANTVAGLNEWPHSGADDMFFHAGFAARNAVTSVELASLGARGSASALDGKAGLFTVLHRANRAADVRPFAGEPEILSVFHKPAPACNYAQTACQVAERIAADLAERGATADELGTVQVHVSAAAMNYPGCNYPGPCGSVLQAKMSIHFGVAAVLLDGAIREANYRAFEEARVRDLASRIDLSEAAEYTAAYPGKQGSRIEIALKDGQRWSRELADLVPATEAQIRARFRSSGIAAIGESRVRELEQSVDGLEELANAGDVARASAASPLGQSRTEVRFA